MADMIEGARFLATHTPAWHYKGTVLDKDLRDIIEAVMTVLPEAYHNKPIYYRNDQGELVEASQYRLITRDGNWEIGAVGKDYELVQPVEAVAPIQPFLDSNLCNLDCIGVLYHGKRMFVTLKLNKTAEVIKNDPIEAYLVVIIGFDGTCSYCLMFTDVRVVCANTVKAAMAGESSLRFNLRHTKNIRDRMIDAHTVVAKAIAAFDERMEVYKQLATKPMNAAQMITYVQRVFIPEELEAKLKEENKEPSPQLTAKVTRVLDLLTEQDGLDAIPAIHGTAWQAYNAVTQYLTHEQGRNEETRLTNQWFGSAAALNNRALQLALN